MSSVRLIGSRALTDLRVFFSGAAVMIVEIAGGRVINAVYGSSAVVWGGVIGVVLTALAVGYYVGGRLADRFNPRTVITMMMLCAGVYVSMLPTVIAFLGSAAQLVYLDERLGSVVMGSAVVGVPSVFMGGVVPSAVKHLSEGRAGIGSISGNVYALSTAGSIVGSFSTTFLLLQYVELNLIFLATGISILLIAFLGSGRGSLLNAMLGALFLVLLVASPTFLVCSTAYAGDVKLVTDSEYSRIVVVDHSGRRHLYINGLLHSGMDIGEPSSLPFPYTRLFVLGPLLNPLGNSVLFVGGGGFSGPKFFADSYEGLSISVVEIDGKVVDVARQFFHLTEYENRMQIVVMDGRRYLVLTEGLFDIIVLDAYSKNYIPFHMVTQEFFTLLKSRLNEGGIVVSNVIASLSGPASAVLWAYVKTVMEVFGGEVLVVPVSSNNSLDVQNVMVVFGKRQLPEAGHLQMLVRYDRVASSLGIDEPISRAFLVREPPSDAVLITDGFAPIENLMNPITMSRFGESYLAGTWRPSICA
ncbi:MAG: fused MFS/spermidine synthase [Thaumarchaeota archaeon]|nr:fused MFS/spermidine synthase [Candidatus Calditenuaceae archaeon]MDW8187077.1 fused MFS/spermidine synthase [Nitrososphaerota archaeon]